MCVEHYSIISLTSFYCFSAFSVGTDCPHFLTYSTASWLYGVTTLLTEEYALGLELEQIMYYINLPSRLID